MGDPGLFHDSGYHTGGQRGLGNPRAVFASRRFSYRTISAGTAKMINTAARLKKTAAGEAMFVNVSPKEYAARP
jgi:hypothetical protein